MSAFPRSTTVTLVRYKLAHQGYHLFYNNMCSMKIPVVDTTALTPVQKVGRLWLKRDDLFTIPEIGICGGKARACWVLAQNAPGLVTGCSRLSPQQQLVSRVAELFGVPCHIHTALGAYTAEMQDAVDHGASMFQHYNGFSGTLSAKARRESRALGWTNIPFGMESDTAVACTRNQVRNLPDNIRRIVVTIGSGISVAGILYGLQDLGRNVPVLGVRVGGGHSGQKIKRRLDRFAPWGWQRRLTIVQANVPYESAVIASAGGIEVDPHYEGKVVEFLQDDDLFWVVGKRPGG